jgi:uncharacterized protein YukE
MTRIIVVPETLRSLSAQLQRAAQEINAVSSRVGGALGGLDWEARQKAGVDGQANDARSRASTLANQAETMARYLTSKAQAFEQADQQGAADLDTVIRQYPLPVPVPAPTPVPDSDNEETPPALSVENAIKGLDDLLKPIDWTSKSKAATKAFNEALKEIGRILNAVTGQRGHIKLMTELGDVLTGATKTVGAASNLIDLRDFNRYFAGELTNQQIADTAIKALVPIPVLNGKLAAWMIANLPDPNGKWHGLVTPVE